MSYNSGNIVQTGMRKREFAMEIRTVTACYFSPTDTTKKTVEAIAHGIRPVINILDLTLPSAREAQYHFGPEDLLVIGAPVYGGRIPLVEEEAIRHIHGSCTPVVLAAVYGNRAYEDALLELRDLLSCQGFIPAAAGAFIGEHSFGNVIAAGRPDAQDLAKCADFGRQIAFWLQNSTVGDFSLKVPGHYPYRARGAQSGIAHQISSDCIFCLHCAEVCPTGAISSKSPAIQDVSLCIKCQACAKKCPKSARIVPGGFLETMVEKLSAMCGDSRKEPEFFLGR